MENCTIPHIADALGPFVKTRQEASQIRQGLQAYLERQLALDGLPLTVANASNPPLSRPLSDPPSALTGVRKAYWRALRAHQAAQTRYETLKTELAQSFQDESESQKEESSVTSGTDLLPLLRQRERRRKLIVLERAVSGIEAEGSGLLGAGVDDLVRTRVGEVPVAPSQNSFASHSEGRKAEVDERLIRLKKAVLSAKRVVDESQNGTHDRAAVNATLKQARSESYALQQARNELITWIEKQLALISEGQGGDDEDVTGGDESIIGDGVSSEEIAQLYDRYIEARRQILQNLESPPMPMSQSTSSTPEMRRSTGMGAESNFTASMAVVTLPYAQSLLSMKREEQAQLQQAAYARRQLAVAETEADRVLRRLADESHLVHPGASKGADWAAAASESSAATKQFVESKVKIGTMAAREADDALEAVEKLPASLEQLGQLWQDNNQDN